jgi:multimeric flavodoxin WrbA
MKILGICGSPRKGNTEQMLDWVLESCKAGGAEVEMIKLREHNIKFCTGCNACYGTDRSCVIEDDMEKIISKLLETDCIIFGSPNYFNNVSGMMKNFIDRTNPLCDPPLLKGKVGASVLVGARPKKDLEVVRSIVDNYFEVIMKMSSTGSVLAQAEDPGEVTKQDDTKLACTDLGNRILDKLRG